MKYEDLEAARAKWANRGTARPPWADTPRPGQESVWDYPRPAVCEPTEALLEIEFDGVTIAKTTRGARALETSHPPTYYFPPDDVRTDLLKEEPGSTVCEWKGEARYFTLVGPSGRRAKRAIWCYPRPFPGWEGIAGWFAFYAKDMDACRVNGQVAQPQPGGFYAGWVTPDLAGPFKGGPGSMGW